MAKIDGIRFLDLNLHKIRYSVKNGNLLMVTILTRYCPGLLEFKFDSNRTIEPEILALAKEINNKFPFVKAENDKRYSDINVIFNYKPYSHGDVVVKPDELDKWCKMVFESGFVKRNFCQFFPKSLYNFAKKYMETHEFNSLSEVYAVLAIAKIAHDCEASLDSEKKNGFEFLNAMAELSDDGTGEKIIDNLSDSDEVKSLKERILSLEHDLNGVRNSRTYKVGNLILYLPKKIKGLIRKNSSRRAK